SLLLMFANLRIKSFPKVLGIIEAILKSSFGYKHIDLIIEHLEEFLDILKEHEMNNRYLITWIIYFIRANYLDNSLKKTYNFSDPIVCATHKDKFTVFDKCQDFKIFSDVQIVAKEVTLLEHLDVFKPQE
ncbi:MAG: hypothetical protein ACYTX0_23800, partial [Nostoc sp.]